MRARGQSLMPFVQMQRPRLTALSFNRNDRKMLGPAELTGSTVNGWGRQGNDIAKRPSSIVEMQDFRGMSESVCCMSCQGRDADEMEYRNEGHSRRS